MDSKELLGEFLDDVWGKGTAPRKVCLAYKPKPNEFDVVPPQQWPAKRETILQFIQGISARGQTVYYNPAMFDMQASSNTKEHCIASWVLWIDFDGNAADARTRLKATPSLPEPSWTVQSGLSGHEHWYWVLDAPAAAQRVEELNKKLAYYLEGDTGCWNMNRVMRPPYTTNYMDAKKYLDVNGESKYDPQPVDFIKKTGNRYKPEQFDFLPSVNASMRENLSELGDIPPLADVLAKYKWDDLHLSLFKDPPPGERSNLIVRLAYFAAEAGMPDEAIYAVINDLDNRLGKFVGRADRERRLAEIILKARAKYPYKDYGMKVRQTTEDIKMVYTANELLRSDFAIEWLIPEVLVANTINFISAESGIGKSRLSMQLAKAMATGTQFLKWPVPRQISVMYLSLEMAGDMLKHFLEGLLNKQEMDEEQSNKFFLVPVGKAIDVSSPEGLAYIEMFVKEYKPEVLMIDAMGKLAFDELGETQAKAINNQMNYLIQEYGVTILMIHHNRKPDLTGKKRPGLGDVYGNQYVVTDASTVMTMFMPENQAHVELIFVKSRATMASDSITMNGTKGFSFVIREGVEPDDPDGNVEPKLRY
jgi:hypothetical protein